jgi:AGCS family alanine or glycine:cation symporter
MDTIVAINDWVNGIVWGPPFLVLLVGTGIYLSVRLGFFQFTGLGLAWKKSFGTLFAKKESAAGGAITSFQAVSSAMAATVGVGNIAGVSTALALGGPGAIFWMWISAVFGMMSKFGEAALGVKYRKVNEDGSVQGGAMFYIEMGLGKKWKPLAVAFAFMTGIAALGIGNMVQANTMAHALETGFGLPPLATGIAVLVLVGLVILGGIKRIGKVAEFIVPFMIIVYVVGAIVILALNVGKIPGAFGMIFGYAFRPSAAVGGFAGAAVSQAIRRGIARGVFSNEAGLGSASIAHAQAKNTPVRQGMWGMWEVFIDTLIVCTMTALVVLVTDALPTGMTGAALASEAFKRGLGGVGGTMVLLGLSLFSYTTMLSWCFYGEQSWEYLFGKKIILPYRLVFLAFLVVGAIGGLHLIWDIADTLNGLMAIPNLIALVALAGVLAKDKIEYLKELKTNKDA